MHFKDLKGLFIYNRQSSLPLLRRQLLLSESLDIILRLIVEQFGESFLQLCLSGYDSENVSSFYVRLLDDLLTEPIAIFGTSFLGTRPHILRYLGVILAVKSHTFYETPLLIWSPKEGHAFTRGPFFELSQLLLSFEVCFPVSYALVLRWQIVVEKLSVEDHLVLLAVVVSIVSFGLEDCLFVLSLEVG